MPRAKKTTTGTAKKAAPVKSNPKGTDEDLDALLDGDVSAQTVKGEVEVKVKGETPTDETPMTAEEEAEANRKATKAMQDEQAAKQPKKEPLGEGEKVKFLKSPTGKHKLAYNAGEKATVYDPDCVAAMLEDETAIRDED